VIVLMLRRGARLACLAVVAAAVAVSPACAEATTTTRAEKSKDATTTKDAKSTTDATTPTRRVEKANACKVLTRAQIEQVLGGEAQRVARRRVGPDVECDWSVASGGDRPAGSLSVGVSFDVPPGAYPALTNNPGFEVIEGIGDADALYQPFTGTVNVFKGRRILKVRGVFNDATTRPIRSYDARTELLELAKLAEARL
jgi:hypothetical protein